jgi:hypothetical protein
MPRNAGKAVRIPDDLHAEVARAASAYDVTIAEFVEFCARVELGLSPAEMIGDDETTEEVGTTLYRCWSDDDVLLYVGISGRMTGRIYEHQIDKPWWSEVETITLEHFRTRQEAADAEHESIRTETPRYNRTEAKRRRVRRDRAAVVERLRPLWPDPEDATARAQPAKGRGASVTVPTTRARTPRRPGPEVAAKCPHPMSVRIGNRCGRCGQAVR